ncbi:phosphoribosylamine--glycine ligase [Marinicella gelatinilytica]|uniref:phosphoribosylamine--glycine ligase n=1 Tax=Marinicella gelatinilytica TaxID=2996017 RepID=UPI002260A830|nr:phosphoribosylamine--glycine ligase [Marinicella gelatinilytica]MCX7544529.1 phosphoribosylamine--glycine ligase [Marinicella gelatinilytica]
MMTKNRVLIIGSGGREHALAWRMAQSSTVDTVFVAPGNAGTQQESGVENVVIDTTDFQAVIDFCHIQQVSLVVVGPEQPLVDGMVDALSAAEIPCFGPKAAAARLEGSKTFTKRFMQKNAIPTADYAEFSDLDKALKYLQSCEYPQVIKADGLAAGKGVVIVKDQQQGEAVATDMLSDNKFGEAGRRIVIEEFLHGEEASYIVISDGKTFIPMVTSQDHKARDDGDQGPNTGGMGAYSPAPVVTPEIEEKIIEQVIKPTLKGMAKEQPFVGFLYAGVMINQGEVKVLEFNVRMGDPETQPIMMRLKSDLDSLCLAAVNGELAEHSIQWDKRPALGVVMAAGGYPENYAKGAVIEGLPVSQTDVKVFHAGTAVSNEQVVTSGGRVLCVCALGDNLTEAQQKAYAGVQSITWQDVYYRTDIGHRALSR